MFQTIDVIKLVLRETHHFHAIALHDCKSNEEPDFSDLGYKVIRLDEAVEWACSLLKNPGVYRINLWICGADGSDDYLCAVVDANGFAFV